MTRCTICWKPTAAPISTIAKDYSAKADGEVNLCKDCFNLLIWNDTEKIKAIILDRINSPMPKSKEDSLNRIREMEEQLKQLKRNKS